MKNVSKDLFETTKPRKVTVTYKGIPFSVPVSAYFEEYNTLIEVHKKVHPWAGPCLVVRGLPLHAVHVALDVHVVEGASCRYDSISSEVFESLWKSETCHWA